jgi:hypothetical protein
MVQDGIDRVGSSNRSGERVGEEKAVSPGTWSQPHMNDGTMGARYIQYPFDRPCNAYATQIGFCMWVTIA